MMNPVPASYSTKCNFSTYILANKYITILFNFYLKLDTVQVIIFTQYFILKARWFNLVEKIIYRWDPRKSRL